MFITVSPHARMLVLTHIHILSACFFFFLVLKSSIHCHSYNVSRLCVLIMQWKTSEMLTSQLNGCGGEVTFPWYVCSTDSRKMCVVGSCESNCAPFLLLLIFAIAAWTNISYIFFIKLAIFFQLCYPSWNDECHVGALLVCIINH